MVWSVPPAEKPVICGCDLIGIARGSINKLKIRGDRGYPCLVPLEIEKGEASIPDKYTLADGLAYRAMMAESIFPPNPNVSSTLTKYCQCIRSMAFSASSVRSREGLFFISAKCKILISLRVASDVCLFLVKPNWSGWISVGNMSTRWGGYSFCIDLQVNIQKWNWPEVRRGVWFLSWLR